MPTEILMPALSPTMEEGTLAKWHVREGDRVQSGDVIAEIETDKATMEVEAVDEGTIGKILIAEGTEHVPVNKPIALLVGDEDEAEAATPSPQPSPAKGNGDRVADSGSGFTSPQGGDVAARRAAGEGALSPDHGDAASIAKEVMTQIAEQIRRNGKDRVFASPLARRLAQERGLDLSALQGSGPHGRIIKRDVDGTAPARPEAEQEAEAVETVRPTPQPEPGQGPERRRLVPATPSRPAAGMSDDQVLALYEPGTYELIPHDTMRRVIAERLTIAKQTIPHFYLSIDCELDAVLAARQRLNAMAPKDGPHAFKLSVNDFLIKALAMALQKVPRANAAWTEAGLLLHRASDIAVAVALDGGGLFTPVVRNAELKSLSEISNEMKDLAARARSKRLAPHEYQGGGTTLSNLGMYGVDRFDAVINPPQASILAVGRAEKRPVIKDDAVKIATMMSATLSVDHRVIDGALGAELLAAFKAFIEDPVTMLV
jgi:pyruvate dehydrogenase E2 component (dihydrolipoyllysine-residue acetyltransferase)